MDEYFKKDLRILQCQDLEDELRKDNQFNIVFDTFVINSHEGHSLKDLIDYFLNSDSQGAQLYRQKMDEYIRNGTLGQHITDLYRITIKVRNM